MKKRLISVLLLVCMIAALFPGMALSAAAVDAEEAEVVEATEAVAAETNEAAEPEVTENETAVIDEAAQPEAEEAEAVEQTAEAAGSTSNVKSVLYAALYVPANKDAGLEGRVNVKYDALGSVAKVYLPGKADVSQLYFCWDDADITVTKNGETYESGTAPLAAPGKSITYKITKGAALALVTVKTVQGSADVEPMFLELDESQGTIEAMNADETHETKCVGNVIFDGQTRAMSMKGRGNSTWGLPKKPYNITLKNDDAMIPGVVAEKWSLLANYFDNSLIRNKVAMDLADGLGIGLPSRYVDIWMNGEYLGNYLMTPKSDYKAPKGGFHLENDNYVDSEDPQFKIPGMYAIGDTLNDDGYFNLMTIKKIGKDAKKAGWDAAKVEEYFTEAWNALEDFDSENYQNYFDLDSWAKMFLMYEVSKTYDCFAGSLLMHRDNVKDPNSKLVAGPAWDYDVAFGRTLHKFLVGIAEPVQLNAEGWYNDSIGLISVDKPVSLLQELGKHASFMQAVAKVYNANVAVFEDIPANVDRQREILRASALMNNELWGTQSLCADYLVAPNTMRALGTGQYALNYEVTLTWENYVNNLKEFCSKRVLWLSDHLYARAPLGSIVMDKQGDDVVLTTTLSAGNNANAYQWQCSTDGGKTWFDVEGANEASLTLTNAAACNGNRYRCYVTNEGVDIYTTHGGWTKAMAASTLEPVTIDVETTQALTVKPEYAKLPYQCYTYIGDSISWGYGLDPADGHADPNLVCARIDGSFTDLVGKVLEAVNPDAEVYSASSSGGRMSDFRMILERGLGVEDPYTYPDDWFGNRNAVRTNALRAEWPSICEEIRKSDLVTIEAGINDLSSLLVNALEASGVIDVEKLLSISDASDVADYLANAMKNVVKSPTMLTNVTRAFNQGVQELRKNSDEVIKDVIALSPDADVLVVGMYNATKALRVLPGSGFSPILDLIGAALVSLNDYYAELANKYDNVYYVDVPDATTIYTEGTTVLQALQNKEMSVLKGLHPDAAGHRYMADRVLAKMVEINHCRHTNTKTTYESKKLIIGFQYIGKTVCADCGEVLDSGKFVTPTGTVNVPTYTVGYAATSVNQAISNTNAKIVSGFSSLFGKK